MSRIRGTSRGRIPASEESPVSNARPRRACPNALQGELGEVAFMHKATSLGFALALPYGHLHRYDFILEGGRNLWRVQVKTSTFLVRGFYRLCVYNYNSRGAQAYTESEIDFIAVYIFPKRLGTFCRCARYWTAGLCFSVPRDARHLLREPNGLTFG